MKFKKVEIQAFRAYQNRNDGTFDFEIEEDNVKEVADFISIYAPNGFGKTSFYDAVEYGITNSIDRFLKNKLPKDIATNERALKKGNEGQKILRNRFITDNSINSEIRLFTTGSRKPIVRNIPKIKRKNSTDFHFNKDLVENEYFQAVILSQEWIDAFLKVDDPKDRYEKFMKFFGDGETSEYYKSIVNLLSHNSKKIEELKKSLQWKQQEINFEGDKEIVKKVNEKVRDLNAAGEKLKPIDESYTEEEAIVLSNVISERNIQLEFEKKSKINQIEIIDGLFTGSETLKGVETYYQSKNERTGLVRHLEEIKTILNRFKQKQQYAAEKVNLNNKQQEFLKKEEFLKELLKMFPSYEKILAGIRENESEIEKENERKVAIDKDLKALRLEEAKNKTEINQANEQVKFQDESLEKVITLHSKVTNNKERLKKLLKEIDERKKQIETHSKRKQFIELEITTYEQALENLTNNIYPSAYEKEFISYKEVIQEIESFQKEIKEKRAELDHLNQKIKEQEEFVKDIESFITKGSEIVDKAQNSTCPLCSHEYTSFDELSEKISSNKFLSKELSNSIKSRSEIENRISNLTKNLKDKTNLLRENIKKDILSQRKSLTSAGDELNTNKESLKSLEEENDLLHGEIDKLKHLLNNLSFEEYKKNILDSINTQKIKINGFNGILKKIQADLKQHLSEKENIERKFDILKKAITELKEDETYKAVINFFNKNFPAQEISFEKLTERHNSIVKELQDISLSKEGIDDKLKELDEILENTTEELSQKELDKFNNRLEELQKIIKSFEREIETQLGFEVNELNQKELTERLENIRDKELELVKAIEQKILNFNLLSKLKQNVEPFLKYQKAKKEEAELRKEKRFLEKEINPLLEHEKQKVSAYLDNQVRSFFYEDLINDLYKRIDPHPEYKRIKFVCDFKEDKPKLNVCLYKDGSDDDLIIPNLYFSTAQLNILSLSIFLAKALNAKDDKGNSIDCIFIDDPIQSMDSINILSTIDLFRSIVVNQEKQIILSTHDENFHNLLKKKMPTSLFKSKFLELETFGKVKQEQAL